MRRTCTSLPNGCVHLILMPGCLNNKSVVTRKLEGENHFHYYLCRSVTNSPDGRRELEIRVTPSRKRSGMEIKMNNQQVMENHRKSAVLTMTGMAIMVALTVTKVVPSSKIAGYSVFVGIAFFFLTEAASKAKGSESGLRFHTILADLKKPGVVGWALFPCVSGIVTMAAGNLMFSGEYVSHLIGRTSSVGLSLDQAALLVGQVVLAAFGEEIAYRGFFLGKGMKLFPFWICAVASSVVFAAGHIAPGNIGIVLYDVAGVWIDSLIFSVIYYKSGNCVISTLSHILGNAVSLAIAFRFL